jgi:steroid delta-isomerase
MFDAQQVRKLYDRYPEMVTKGDVDGIVALYADDATIEDPIGSPVHRGTEAIRKFYQGATAAKVNMKRAGSVHVAGREAATPLKVLIGPEGQQQVIDIISVMAFREDGKIASMRAFWSADAIRPATPED